MTLGAFKLGDSLTFAVNTSSPTTGAESDADAAPTYRVYENETGTAILTGTMALLDDANTVGFYSESITLSTANGFEEDKCYTIRARAVVETVANARLYFFTIPSAPVTVILEGPYKLLRVNASDPLTIDAWVGDEKTYIFDLQDADGDLVPIAGYDITVTVTDSTGTAIVDAAAATVRSDDGTVQWTMADPWDTAGTYNLTVRADGGANDIHTFGPITVEVKAL